MRLNQWEKRAITEAIRRFDPNAGIWIFGSRADDDRRGGDIDIAILSNRIHRRERHAIRHHICDQIGEQKIDLVVASDHNDPMFAIAVERGVAIDENPKVN